MRIYFSNISRAKISRNRNSSELELVVGNVAIVDSICDFIGYSFVYCDFQGVICKTLKINIMYEIHGFRPYVVTDDGNIGGFKELREPVICETWEEVTKWKKAKLPYYRKKYPESTFVDIDLLIREKGE